MEIVEFVLTHAVQFLLVAVGIFIVLYSFGKFTPDPFKFLLQLFKILVNEFSRGNKITAERIDAGIILGFLLITLLCGLCELVPSLLKQIVGADVQAKPETTSYFLTCLVFLFLTTITSPVWIYILQREQRLLRQAEDTLNSTNVSLSQQHSAPPQQPKDPDIPS